MQLYNPPLVGMDAVEAFLSTLKPKDGSTELWLKQGHAHFFRLNWDNLSVGYSTAKEDSEDEKSRKDTKKIKNIFSYLLNKCEKDEGGLFFIPTQPQGLPLESHVETSDDIGIELDELTYDEQLARIRWFCEVSGIELASLLTSAGKSLHFHIKFTDHIELDKRKYIIRLLVLLLNGDPVTERPHQPMRFPGGYRKEKEGYQELLFTSHTRYEYEDLVERIKTAYEADDRSFPDEIPDDWWSEKFYQIIKHKTLTLDAKDALIRKFLFYGYKDWQVVQESKKIVKQQKRESYESRKAKVKNLQGESILDLVRKTCEDLEEEPFLHPDHDWAFDRASHARGMCLWHDTTSANSAWLDARDGWSYHCPTCTQNKPIDAFDYWRLSKCKDSSEWEQEITGVKWIKEAKVWLEENGVEVPEFSLEHLIENAHKFPDAPELEIDEEGKWEDELEKAIRVAIVQDRMAVRVRQENVIKSHFGINDSQLKQIAIDCNSFKREDPEAVESLVPDILTEIQTASSGQGEDLVLSAIPGLESHLLKGLEKGLKVVLAAESSTGKTALCLKEACNLAKTTMLPVVIFSAESPRKQLIYRLLAQLTHIELGRLFSGRINPDEWDILLDAVVELSSIPLYIDGTPNISTSQIRAKLIRLSDEVGTIRGVFVDHMQRLAKPYPGKHVESLTSISNELCNITDELNATGVFLSQFNRNHTGRQTKEPEISDILGASAIEQDADVILMPFRPGKNNDKIDPEKMDIFIRKNRDGPTGAIKVRFRGEYVDIESAEGHKFEATEEDPKQAEPDKSQGYF